MGANATLSTFVTGTTISSAAMNNNLNNINTSNVFLFQTGSLTGISTIGSNVNVTTTFTNPMGIKPSFGWGVSDAGALHLVCWDINGSSTSVIKVVPDSANGGTHWLIWFLV